MAFPEYISDTSSNNTLYLLTSDEEIRRVLSTKGESWQVDDMSDTNENYDEDNIAGVSADNFRTEVKQRVTSLFMEYLAPKYSITAVYRIPRLRQMATYVACYEITKRRGNEPLYEDEYIRAIDTLEQYRDGTLYLPAPSAYQRAYLVSGVVDNRYSQVPYRILERATTKVLSNERTFQFWGFNWL